MSTATEQRPRVGEPTNELVLTYLPLVGYAVQSLIGRLPLHVDRSDLASAGHVALVQAARAFDPSTGVPFGRYAALRIRGALLDELRSRDWLTRSARTAARGMTEARDRLASQLGRVPTREEIAQVMGVCTADVDAARDASVSGVLSLNGFTCTVQENLTIDDAATPEQHAVATEQLAFLRAGVSTLPAGMRDVIEGTYFLERTDLEMAEATGVTRSRVSQIRAAALELLRDGMHANLDPDLLAAGANPGGVQDRRRRAFYASMAAQAAIRTTGTPGAGLGMRGRAAA